MSPCKLSPRGIPLWAQLLEVHISAAGTQVRSLLMVSPKLHGMAKKQKQKQTNKQNKTKQNKNTKTT